MQNVQPELLEEPTPQPVGTTGMAQFFIPAAASLQERRPRTLKHGDTFALFDHNGDALSGPGSPEGIFHRDTRYLSHLYLTINGQRPLLLSSILRDDNAALTCDLTNPDLHDAEGKLVLEHDLVHIRRSRFVWKGGCYERLSLHNYDTAPQGVRLDLAFAADFADLFEVRGTKRERRGTHHAAEIGRDHIRLSYTGLDDRRRETSLRFEPAPTRLAEGSARFDVLIEPQKTAIIFIEIACDRGRFLETPRRAFSITLRDARRALRASSGRACAIASSNDVFNEGVRRAVSDLYMLITDTEHGPYPYAGIPWFSTVFGRDAIITAFETLWLDPQIARGVLTHLAANQAVEEDPAADAEPGKILHEVRYGEMAELGEVPFRRYYGSVDSTPLFVMLAGAYLDRTGDIEALRGLWPAVIAALGWIDDYGDRDGDGFVEYGRRTAEGLVNQGWKDSYDSVFHEDGRLARGPIALVEVQAYVYGAWLSAARIARRLGDTARAQGLENRAEVLRRRFDEAFFDDELGTYVLALDGEKRPCRVRTSNAGHALFTGIAFPDRAARVVETLMNRASFSGWGVRTLGVGEARYNPMSYHNGSVWPHDNALIGFGFSRYGFRTEAARIFEGLFAASMYIDLRRLPELFCGFPRQRGQGPTFYPVACAPQAWAAATPLGLTQACLGIGFDPGAERVTFDHPILPDFLDAVTLTGLEVGRGLVDVSVTGHGSQVSLQVLRRRGEVSVQATI